MSTKMPSKVHAFHYNKGPSFKSNKDIHQNKLWNSQKQGFAKFLYILVWHLACSNNRQMITMTSLWILTVIYWGLWTSANYLILLTWTISYYLKKVISNVYNPSLMWVVHFGEHYTKIILFNIKNFYIPS
jgi:hypothetical protein